MVLDNATDDPDKASKVFNQNLNIAITCIYGLEAILKIFSIGFFYEKTSYIRDPWNLLDFFCLIISIYSIAFSSGLGFFKALRTLRLLKLSQRFAGLEIVLVALLKSFPYIMILILFTLAYLIFMGLFPLKFLKGSSYAC